MNQKWNLIQSPLCPLNPIYHGKVCASHLITMWVWKFRAKPLNWRSVPILSRESSIFVTLIYLHYNFLVVLVIYIYTIIYYTLSHMNIIISHYGIFQSLHDLRLKSLCFILSTFTKRISTEFNPSHSISIFPVFSHVIPICSQQKTTSDWRWLRRGPLWRPSAVLPRCTPWIRSSWPWSLGGSSGISYAEHVQYPLVNIQKAIENGWIFPYVKLPEGRTLTYLVWVNYNSLRPSPGNHG